MNSRILPPEIWTVIANDHYLVFKSLFLVDTHIHAHMNNIKHVSKYPITKVYSHTYKMITKRDIIIVNNNCIIYENNEYIINIEDNIIFEYYTKYNMLVAYVSDDIVFVIYNGRTLIDFRNSDIESTCNINNNRHLDYWTKEVAKQSDMSIKLSKMCLIHCKGDVVAAIMEVTSIEFLS